MQQLIFITPLFKERIWGGNQLATEFGYTIPNDKAGEAWLVSAHKNGDCVVASGQYAGLTLSQLWSQHPELFNSKTTGEFPLMVKIIDAADDLSVQVHPNDDFALIHENDLGKEECWYILKAETNAQIVYGHTAQSQNELIEMIDSNQWDKLLTHCNAKKGNFFNVPTGTIHAIKSGLLILEVQQSSDTTYRLYDYQRRDDAGNLRELHLDKAKQVITVPHHNSSAQNKIIYKDNHVEHVQLLQNNYFTVEKLALDNSSYDVQKPNIYWIINAVSGTGKINGEDIRKGESCIAPSQIETLKFGGNLELIISYEANLAK